MTPEHREEMIAILIIWTGRSRAAFENKTDREIVKLYGQHVG